MKKPFYLFLFFLFLGFRTFAQFSWVQIGVDGLTCSACSRSVEMSIRKLSFVDSVVMNLEHTQGKITFKKEAKVDIDKIAKAVTDAGFSLRSLYAGITIPELTINNDFCWILENNNYHFIKVADSKVLKGTVALQFVGEKFMSKKEFKNWKMFCITTCTNSSISTTPFSKTYYVSFQ